MDKDIKAALDDLLKELAQNQKALAAASSAPELDQSLPQPVQKAVELTKAQADKAAKAFAEMEADFEKLQAEMAAAMAKALAECKAAADKATKAYMAAIKNTDGLTSAKPSIVKVLQATGKEPDPKAIETAVTELRKHRDEMNKAHGKDKDKAKMLAAFTRDLDLAAKELGSLL